MARQESESTSAARPAGAFGDRLIEFLNHGAFCLMASIGHRTGLFDAMRDQPPLTSGGIAARAGLNERYVREWLGAMVTAGVVEVDTVSLHYRLPAGHAAFLTRAAGGDNIASWTQYIAVLGSVEDDIVECFRNGGGVPYGKFPRFHDVMAEDSGQAILSSLETQILPLVPGLASTLAHGGRVLDVGCGRGLVMLRLASDFPNSRFTGIDFSAEAIRAARADSAERGLANIEFLEADAGELDGTTEAAAFDLITTFDAIHDQARPLDVLKGIHRALRDDGIFLMQDIRGSSLVHNNIPHPLGTFLYTVSCLHCMTVSLAQGGEGLGAMWGEERTREYLARAGFQSIETHRLPHDLQNNWYVIRKR